MNANEVIERIKEIKGFKINYSELARIIGIQRQNMKRYKEADLLERHIQAIEDHFKISFTGDDYEPELQNDYVSLPVRGDVTASLGSGLYVMDERQTATFQVPRQLIKFLGANEKTTDIIPAQGNSMRGTIEDGDSLMVDRSKKEIIDGKIYVVRIDGQLLAKRLQKIPPSSIMVISDNPDYKPYPVDLKDGIDFEIIGQVLWYSRIAR